MPIWERINQQQSAEAAAARQAEAEVRQAAQQRADEQRLRGERLLGESGALQALGEVQRGLEQDDRRNGLNVGGLGGLSRPGVATLTAGVSDTHCKVIEVRVDPQRDEVVIMKAGEPDLRGRPSEPVEQRISRAQWESDPSAVETAIAAAYLHPARFTAITRNRSQSGNFPPDPIGHPSWMDIHER